MSFNEPRAWDRGELSTVALVEALPRCPPAAFPASARHVGAAKGTFSRRDWKISTFYGTFQGGCQGTTATSFDIGVSAAGRAGRPEPMLRLWGCGRRVLHPPEQPCSRAPALAGTRRFSQNHRMESQHGRGWKGPLWVTQPNPLPKQGHSRL